MQILAIDLGTDMVPALGLGVESPEEGVMDKPPRRLLGRLLNRQLLLKAFVWYRLIDGRGSIFQVKHFTNRIISLGIVLEIVLFIILSYVPLFHTLFNTAPIGLDDWLYLLACPFVIMTLEEIRYRLFDKK